MKNKRAQALSVSHSLRASRIRVFPSFSGASGTGRGCRKIRNLLHAASPLSSVYAIIAYNRPSAKKSRKALSFPRK
jgi:hypothetical protein